MKTASDWRLDRRREGMICHVHRHRRQSSLMIQQARGRRNRPSGGLEGVWSALKPRDKCQQMMKNVDPIDKFLTLQSCSAKGHMEEKAAGGRNGRRNQGHNRPSLALRTRRRGHASVLHRTPQDASVITLEASRMVLGQGIPPALRCPHAAGVKPSLGVGW